MGRVSLPVGSMGEAPPGVEIVRGRIGGLEGADSTLDLFFLEGERGNPRPAPRPAIDSLRLVLGDPSKLDDGWGLEGREASLWRLWVELAAELE